MNEMETGVDFNFTYAPGITEEQILGVELAGEIWSNYLGDTHHYIDHDIAYIENTVINIHVEMGSNVLPDNVIGGAFPAFDEEEYEDIYDALTGDVKTSNDQVAVDSLSNNSSLFDNKKTKVLVNGEVLENDKMQLTTANLKALDLIDVTKDEYQKLDGYIVLSDLSNFSSVEWNYDYLGEAKPDTLDFLSTITHEIGHTLGFISGTDRISFTTELLEYYQTFSPVDVIEQAMLIADDGKYSAQLDGSDSNNQQTFTPRENKDENKFLLEQEKFFNAVEVLSNLDDSVSSNDALDALKAVEKYLEYDDNWEAFLEQDKDIFKRTKDKLDHLNFKKLAERMTSLDLFRYSTASSNLGANELTRGSTTYFSLDGSQTDIAMSDRKDYQGSHWQNRELTEGIGVMNPTVALNEKWSISGNDLMALDAIGWDVNYSPTMDLQALYDEASAAIENAWIGDRTDDVDDILESDAYEARRGTSSSYRMLSGAYFSSIGYFSTFSPSTDTMADSSVKGMILDKNNSVVTFELNSTKPAEVGENLTVVNDNFIDFSDKDESNPKLLVPRFNLSSDFSNSTERVPFEYLGDPFFPGNSFLRLYSSRIKG